MSPKIEHAAGKKRTITRRENYHLSRPSTGRLFYARTVSRRTASGSILPLAWALLPARRTPAEALQAQCPRPKIFLISLQILPENARIRFLR